MGEMTLNLYCDFFRNGGTRGIPPHLAPELLVSNSAAGGTGYLVNFDIILAIRSEDVRCGDPGVPLVPLSGYILPHVPAHQNRALRGNPALAVRASTPQSACAMGLANTTDSGYR